MKNLKMKEKTINQEEVEKIAALARIELSAKEKSLFSKELGTILDYFKNIQEFSDSQVDSFNHFEYLREPKNNQREDKVKEMNDKTRKAIKNLFPRKKDNYLKVRAVIKNGKH